MHTLSNNRWSYDGGCFGNICTLEWPRAICSLTSRSRFCASLLDFFLSLESPIYSGKTCYGRRCRTAWMRLTSNRLSRSRSLFRSSRRELRVSFSFRSIISVLWIAPAVTLRLSRQSKKKENVSPFSTVVLLSMFRLTRSARASRARFLNSASFACFALCSSSRWISARVATASRALCSAR